MSMLNHHIGVIRLRLSPARILPCLAAAARYDHDPSASSESTLQIAREGRSEAHSDNTTCHYLRSLSLGSQISLCSFFLEFTVAVSLSREVSEKACRSAYRNGQSWWIVTTQEWHEKDASQRRDLSGSAPRRQSARPDPERRLQVALNPWTTFFASSVARTGGSLKPLAIERVGGCVRCKSSLPSQESSACPFPVSLVSVAADRTGRGI